MVEIENMLREVAIALEVIISRKKLDDTQMFDKLYRLMSELSEVYNSHKVINRKLNIILDSLGRTVNDVKGENDEDPIPVLRNLCNLFGITNSEVRDSERITPIVWKRQVISFLLLDYYQFPMKTVKLLVNRDHSTVIHSRKKINEVLQYKATKDPLYEFLMVFDNSGLNQKRKYTSNGSI